MQKPIPTLLHTYEEARLLMDAKGWVLGKATDYLSALPELRRFNVSQASFSRKTTRGCSVPIEPEVAAAVERMETQGWYERQTEIVVAGLRAVHGEPPSVDVRQLAKDLREYLASNELAQKLADALLEKASPLLDTMACGIADRLRATRLVQELGERLDRLSLKRIVVPAVVGALVGCLALLLAPTLPGRVIAASPATPLMLIVTNPVPGGSPVRFDPGSLLALSAMGEKPLDQPIPTFTLPGQKVEPCDSGLGEVAIHGNCWAALADVKPPCGRLFRSGDKCYRPIAADPQKPAEPTPNRPSAP